MIIYKVSLSSLVAGKVFNFVFLLTFMSDLVLMFKNSALLVEKFHQRRSMLFNICAMPLMLHLITVSFYETMILPFVVFFFNFDQ